MKTSLLSSLALASILSLGAFGCASNTADDGAVSAAQQVHTPEAAEARIVQASAEEAYGLYGFVWNVQTIQNDAGMDLDIVEVNGGDPVINGNYLFLNAWGAEYQDGGVFELNLNIATLESAKMISADTIKIVGTRQTIGPENDGDFITVPFEATVKLAVDADGAISSVTVSSDGSAEKLEPSKDANREGLSTIFSVQSKESEGGNIVRLFETGGGDPAMNGDQLMLNIMAWPDSETFDLGINVNSVTKFEVTDTKIIIEGTEHYMHPSDDIQSRPYAYAIDYSVNDSTPPKTLKVTRTR